MVGYKEHLTNPIMAVYSHLSKVFHMPNHRLEIYDSKYVSPKLKVTSQLIIYAQNVSKNRFVSCCFYKIIQNNKKKLSNIE